MRRQTKGTVFSVLLHIFLVYGLISLTAAMENDPPPPVLNFSLIADTQVEKPLPVVDEPPTPKIVNKQIPSPPIIKKIEPVEPKVPEPIPLEKIAVFKPKVTKKKIVPIDKPAPIQPEPKKITKTLPQEPRTQRIVSPSGSHEKTVKRAKPVPRVSPREIYVKEQFSYIKNSIQQTINYPRLARRMGWEGKVIISFIISEDGLIEKVKVVESSGYIALDKNALETVEKSTPFPKPPTRAELIIPVIYRLRG